MLERERLDREWMLLRAEKEQTVNVPGQIAFANQSKVIHHTILHGNSKPID
jgi:hypothetical protein